MTLLHQFVIYHSYGELMTAVQSFWEVKKERKKNFDAFIPCNNQKFIYK